MTKDAQRQSNLAWLKEQREQELARLVLTSQELAVKSALAASKS